MLENMQCTAGFELWTYPNMDSDFIIPVMPHTILDRERNIARLLPTF